MNRGGTERLHMKSRERNGRSSGGGIDPSMEFQAAIVSPGDLVLVRNVNNPAPHYPVSFLRSRCAIETWRDLVAITLKTMI
jgi:hypothetical protein